MKFKKIKKRWLKEGNTFLDKMYNDYWMAMDIGVMLGPKEKE